MYRRRNKKELIKRGETYSKDQNELIKAVLEQNQCKKTTWKGPKRDGKI